MALPYLLGNPLQDSPDDILKWLQSQQPGTALPDPSDIPEPGAALRARMQPPMVPGESGPPPSMLPQAVAQTQAQAAPTPAGPRPSMLPKALGSVTTTAPTAPAPPTPPPGQTPGEPAKPQTAMEQMSAAYDKSDLLRNQAYDKLTPTDADLEGYRRSGTLGQLAGMAMQMLGNESQAAIGGNVLKQSMAEIEKGKRDPWKVGEMEAKKLEAQAAALEKRAQFAVTIEEKRDATKQANDLKREAMQMRQDMAQSMLAMRGAIHAAGGGGKEHLQRAGVTPAGELVTFDPSTGQQRVGGQVYNGPVMSQAAMDKQAGAVQEALGAISSLKNIDALVAANPNAFGGVATLSSLTPQVISSRWQSAKLTPQERETRALVMTQAAQVINDLYGAAVSAGEMGRAQSFVPTNLDNPESVAVKLKAAQAWANQKANAYGAQVRSAAESRSSGTGAPSGGATVSFGELK